MIKIINENWLFQKNINEEFQEVSLPHTPQIEDLEVKFNYQGKFIYKKYFEDIQYINKCNFIYFEGVMMNCKVFVNGNLECEHFGGYLPFMVEVTKYGSKFELTVEVSNFDDPNTPPGKTSKDLDFLYYGGIYRNVHFITKELTYFTQDIQLNEESGVSLLSKKIVEKEYDIVANFVIDNRVNDSFFEIKLELIDGVAVKQTYIDSVLLKHDINYVDKVYRFTDIKEWTCDEPKLYNLQISILKDNVVIDIYKQDYGFRKIEVNQDGFYLNDKKLWLYGFNRHQQFPFLGIAVSDEAHKREARLLKESGINTLRLAHYPQSISFIKECDKLGILLIECVPGWQFIGNEIWQSRLIENVKDMVKRDRNYASVIIFEVTPNESNWANKKGDDFCIKLKNTAKKYKPNCLVGGDTVGRFNSKRINFDVPYRGKDKISFYLPWRKENRKFLAREHGDWSFGGNKSTSRVARVDSEGKLQNQLWNFQHSYNLMRGENNLGALYWEAIDHNRGYCPYAPIRMSGTFDIFRIPKLSYVFIKSQSENKCSYFAELAIKELNNNKVLPIYSNCDTIELYLDKDLIEIKKCDNGEDIDTSRLKKTNDNYWAGGEDHLKVSDMPNQLAKVMFNTMFNGGNCKNLKAPPFTFYIDKVNYTKVKIIGYKNGTQVCEKEYYKDGATKSYSIEFCDKGIKLLPNDNDFIFVYIKALDTHNQIVSSENSEIEIELKNGTVINNSQIKFEAGIATCMIKANKETDNIQISVTYKNKEIIKELYNLI